MKLVLCRGESTHNKPIHTDRLEAGFRPLPFGQ